MYISVTDELEWYVPASLVPDNLQQSLNVIKMFLEKPMDMDGKKAKQLTSKKRQRRARRASVDSDAGELPSDVSEGEGKRRKVRREKKKKEEIKYKSAEFIVDSDAEAGDDEVFFAKEKALQERLAVRAVNPATDTARIGGTKKKKRPKDGAVKGGPRKKRKSSAVDAVVTQAADATSGDDSDHGPTRSGTSPPAGSRTTPMTSLSPRSSPAPSPVAKQPSPLRAIESDDEVVAQTQPRRSTRVVISDDEV